MALLRDLLNWLITRVAWLVADWRGWRAALAVYPPMLQARAHAAATGMHDVRACE